MTVERVRDQVLVQIVGPTDHWVLEQLARRLASKLPHAEFVPWEPAKSTTAKLIYYMNYALFKEPSGLVDVAFFTHLDPAQQFLERAGRVDHCVCMSKMYADALQAHGIKNVTHIPMGFDYYRYRPRLLLGVFGLLDHPRKGKHLVDELRQLPFVDIVVTDGQYSAQELRDLFQRVDYVLIPASVEGGPLSLLEGLAMGRPIIAPDSVGIVPEFAATEHIRRYPVDDAQALTELVTACFQEKMSCNLLVRNRSSDDWAQGHHDLFTRLLRDRGLPVPQPAEGFRFGMMNELEIPWGIEVGELETGLDDAARHLYFGRYSEAHLVIDGLVKKFPFAQNLLGSIPEELSQPRIPATAKKPVSTNGMQDRKKKRLSLISTVLESYEIVRRQLKHLDRILPADCELVLVDDGSVPSLQKTCDSVRKGLHLVVHFTKDRRPWTQPRARNIGASLAGAEKLLFFDIDHILTEEIIRHSLEYEGDKLHWVRKPGILNKDGNVITERQVLLDHGLKDDLPDVHPNSFLIRKALFDRLGGYDERFCGRYGGDDIDFNRRYEQLCNEGLAQPGAVKGTGYVFPDPSATKELFHSLGRKVD